MFGFYDSYLKFFGLTITYYGLIIACAMGIGIVLACKNAKKRNLTSNDILIAACYVLPLAIIGARLYYVAFDTRAYSFVDILKIWDGGLAIFGGVIGGAVGIMFYSLIHKKNYLDVADVVVPTLILGQAIGRIGCYFSGCCYGIETTDPSLMFFPMSVQIDGVWHLATMFYESLWNLIGFGVLILMLRYLNIKQRGAIAGTYLIFYGVGRAIIETFRGDSLTFMSGKISQIVGIIIIPIGIAIILTYFIKDKLKVKNKIKKYKEASAILKIQEENLIKSVVKVNKNLKKSD